MEILKRAKNNAGELVPFNANQKDLKEEVIKRNARAGNMTRYGEPPFNTKIMNRGFGKSKLNIWPRDKHGNLIE